MNSNKNISAHRQWTLYLIAGVVVVSIVLGIVQWIVRDSATETVDLGSEVILNEETCSASGGNWNSCGSACRNEPGEACVAVCVSYCECESNIECPFGLECSDYIDKIGICINT